MIAWDMEILVFAPPLPYLLPLYLKPNINETRMLLTIPAWKPWPSKSISSWNVTNFSRNDRIEQLIQNSIDYDQPKTTKVEKYSFDCENHYKHRTHIHWSIGLNGKKNRKNHHATSSTHGVSIYISIWWPFGVFFPFWSPKNVSYVFF